MYSYMYVALCLYVATYYYVAIELTYLYLKVHVLYAVNEHVACSYILNKALPEVLYKQIQ